MLRKMTLCRVPPRRTLAVLTTNNKVVVKLQMYSLKPHAETLQALRRLMPQKELRKSAPKLSATGEGLQGSTPALLQVLKTLGDSELSTKLPEVYLEYGQILAMQSQAPIGNLLELFQSMCAQISTSERPFDLHILDDGQVSHCEFFWKKDPTRVPSPELSELLLSYGYTIGSNLLQGLTDQLSVFLPYNAPEHADEYAKPNEQFWARLRRAAPVTQNGSEVPGNGQQGNKCNKSCVSKCGRHILSLSCKKYLTPHVVKHF